MALRIAGKKSQAPEAPAEKPAEAPVPEETPIPEDAAPTADLPETITDEPEMSGTGGGPLDPLVAGYKTPDMGPFMCGNCAYYSPSEPNTCSVVSGFIDEGGICNVFSALPPEEELPTEEAAPSTEETPVPEEAPVEATEEPTE